MNGKGRGVYAENVRKSLVHALENEKYENIFWALDTRGGRNVDIYINTLKMLELEGYSLDPLRSIAGGAVIETPETPGISRVGRRVFVKNFGDVGKTFGEHPAAKGIDLTELGKRASKRITGAKPAHRGETNLTKSRKGLPPNVPQRPIR